MRLLLVRHARTASNVSLLLDTAPPGAPLDEVGREQAERLADRLADEPIDALFVSDLVRTAQTAAPLAARRGLVPQVRAGLREIQAGDFELSADPTPFLAVVLSWREDPDARMPGGETGRDTLARFDAVLAEAEAAGHEHVVAVSHGAMIRIWAASRADNVDGAFLRTAHLDNTLVVELTGSTAGGWHVARWGDRIP